MLLGQSIKKYKKQRSKMKSPIPKSNDNNIFLGTYSQMYHNFQDTMRKYIQGKNLKTLQK